MTPQDGLRSYKHGSCLVVGIATIDVINTIPEFPAEDSKIRVTSSRRSRGGNGTNVLVVCAQIGAFQALHWVGTLVDPLVNADSKFICDELSGHYGISLESCELVNAGSMPTSYIMSSDATGSRTIFHHRNLPELSVAHFASQLPLWQGQISWAHFECRDTTATSAMLGLARPVIPVLSLEVEGPRHAWASVKSMLHLVDYVFISQVYVTSLGFTDAIAFLNSLLDDGTVPQKGGRDPDGVRLKAIVCPWGATGAFVRHGLAHTSNWAVSHVPVEPVAAVVDSVGAGDSFVAATISAIHTGMPILDAVAFGCRVGRRKCMQVGLEFDPDAFT
ncbi:hypothetical protein H310_05121 [Aphanomyces invadans]|uniref:Carbohydrate kinase PfkB domain-containing protein n=1 Tax=Aphanomyces invadans TaxID=157072 RepID=A0A024UDP1_9STRA|nr:hypothetical protein H310_05121 [Aphanomyces invadans]ETW03753.1 hypothetical protein H310_05121 [Aphanomyces invadans]|eukprot:XP_008867982.1 hypothetical protein H310_05121 [Aphanomyces invadans]